MAQRAWDTHRTGAVIDFFQIFGRYFWLIAIVFSAAQYARCSRRRMSTLASDTLRDQARVYGRTLFGLQILPWIVMGIGILSGQAHDIWDFMNPPHGGVLLATAFWGVIAATASGTAWWIFTGGARKVVELGLMDQFGYPAERVTERAVKAMAITTSIGAIALLIGCTLMGDSSLRNVLTSLTGNGSPAVSGDGYRIVFDCANGGCANWAFPAFGLCFVAIGAVFAWFRNDLPMRGPALHAQSLPVHLVGLCDTVDSHRVRKHVRCRTSRQESNRFR